MGTDYLLWLQDIRLSLGSGVESAMQVVSDAIGVGVFIAACLVVYWCVDKRAGIFALISLGVGYFASMVVKCVACVYRPWVLDARVEPAESALGLATGYSFPSGHMTIATTVLGSFAYTLRKHHRAVAVLLVVAALLVGFLRNFLGVHTLADVAVALLIGLVSVVACARLCDWLQDHRQHDAKVLAGALGLAVVALAFIILKPYPMDYVDGTLLVDPIDMQKDCFEGIGLFVGLFLGWYCERRWVNFSTDGLTWKARVVRIVVGLVLVALVMLGIDPLLKMALDPRWAKLASRVLVAFCALFVAPAIFGKLKA